MNKRGSLLLMSILIAGIFTIGVLIDNLFLPQLSKNEGNHFPSQCYTDLEPSRFLTNERTVNLLENKEENYLKLEGGRFILSTVQTAGTGSMRPGIGGKASVILISNFTPQDISIGDIIVVKRQGKDDLIHRIIAMNDTKYQTKGDNNNIPDESLWDFEDIRGKVVGVIY